MARGGCVPSSRAGGGGDLAGSRWLVPSGGRGLQAAACPFRKDLETFLSAVVKATIRSKKTLTFAVFVSAPPCPAICSALPRWDFPCLSRRII